MGSLTEGKQIESAVQVHGWSLALNLDGFCIALFQSPGATSCTCAPSQPVQWLCFWACNSSILIFMSPYVSPMYTRHSFTEDLEPLLTYFSSSHPLTFLFHSWWRPSQSKCPVHVILATLSPSYYWPKQLWPAISVLRIVLQLNTDRWH